MKSSIYLKATISLLLLVVFTSAFIDEGKNNIIPYENGMLNGPVVINLPYLDGGSDQSDGQLTGQYVQNQKVGSWKLYDKSHKLLVERNYLNNFEYSSNNVVAEKLKLKRDKKGLYIFHEVEEKNVGASLRIWRDITPQLLDISPKIRMALKEMDLSGLKAYQTDELRKETKAIDIAPPFDELRIMGDWFYDNKLGRSEYRVLAISPIRKANKNTVWYYYPDIRERLHHFNVVSDNAYVTNLDDVLFLGAYPYEVSKTESLKNEPIIKEQRREETVKTIEKTLILEASRW